MSIRQCPARKKSNSLLANIFGQVLTSPRSGQARMSSPPAGAEPSPATSTAPASVDKKAKSGFRIALQYTGIPPSWFDKRPKLPSRNWLIFLSVTSSLIGLYAYDRKKCREIREEYIKRVEPLAQEPMEAHELPRKIRVYASKWPNDEDYTRSIRYFKKYVKVRPTTTFTLIHTYGPLANSRRRGG